MNIQSLYDGGRLPHAVLFVGGGCREHAEYAVKLYIGSDGLNHPDVVLVKESMPDGVYKIKPLREVIGAGNLRPQFGETRVFVFHDFDSMTANNGICQNALLKFIEEPHEYNRFILTAKSVSGILPTVMSRVVVIREDSGDDSPDDSDEQVKAVSKSIIEALRMKSEYDVAAAFSQIKDRQNLIGVLQALLEDFSVVIANLSDSGIPPQPASGKPEKLIKTADVIQKYIELAEFNANIKTVSPITATSCAAEIYKELYK
jgi:DNA polymerase III delta prime subunit